MHTHGVYAKHYRLRDFFMSIPIRTALALFLLLTGVTTASAQMPSFFPGKNLAPISTKASQETVVVDLNKELADAQSRLGEMQNVVNQLQAKLKQSNLSNDDRSDLLKQFNQRQTLVDRYAQQLDDLKQLQVLDQSIGSAKRQRDNWTPPAGSAPWPITQGDQVKNDMAMLAFRIAQITRELRALTDEIATFGSENYRRRKSGSSYYPQCVGKQKYE